MNPTLRPADSNPSVRRELVRVVLQDDELQLFLHPLFWRLADINALSEDIADAVLAQLTPKLTASVTGTTFPFYLDTIITDDMDERTVLLMEMMGANSHTEVEVRSLFIEDDGRRTALADDVAALVLETFENLEEGSMQGFQS
jgi:hypothetical protein